MSVFRQMKVGFSFVTGENEMVTQSRPRLSVLLACEAPVGVVFRRGPSKMVRVYLWDRDRDKFKPCQRFKGRILTSMSDTSPDGRFMIYSAMGGSAWAIPAIGGTWTAISRVPSLTAIALWGQSGSTWGCGGMFTSNHSYWLGSDANTFLIRDTNLLWRERKRPNHSSVQRDGWSQKNGPREVRRVYMRKRFPRDGFCEGQPDSRIASGTNWSSRRMARNSSCLRGNGPSGIATDWYGRRRVVFGRRRLECISLARYGLYLISMNRACSRSPLAHAQGYNPASADGFDLTKRSCVRRAIR